MNFPFFGEGFAIICGPGPHQEERKVEQLFYAVKMVDLERSMLCLTKGTPIDSKDKVRILESCLLSFPVVSLKVAADSATRPQLTSVSPM